jgi:hypothetical protein
MRAFKCVEQIEANSRHDEQIHGNDLRQVIAQEGAPSLINEVRTHLSLQKDAPIARTI